MSIKNIPQSLLDAVNKVLMNEAQEEHPMIEVDGVMKHRHNSLGQPIHHTDEGIRNFHRWFGNSKAVDEHGRPSVFYHGTASDIEHFDQDFIGHGVDQLGSGFYFADSPYIANRYVHGSQNVKHSAAPNILPTYISLKNPIRVGDRSPLKKEHIKKLIQSAPDHKDALSNFGDVDYDGYEKVLNVAVNAHRDIPKLDSMNYIHNDFYSGNAKEFVNNFKKITGHDGVMNDRDEQKIAVVFDPKDIKSATGNSGAFAHPTKITESTKVYYRGTDNNDEPALISSGTLRPSTDHLSGKTEAGVSVSDVPDVGKYFRYMYKVTGTELPEVGSDGEPLLDPKTMKFVDWVKAPTLTESEDYRESHTAPKPENSSPAHDLTHTAYPEDFYSSKGARLYGDGRDDDYKVHSQLRTLRNRPEAEVNIYRAVPNDSKITEINSGDWVTTNLQYAHDHGERFDSHKILSKRVKAKEIFTDGNSFHEFGYHPQD